MAQHTYWTGEGDRILIDAAPRDLIDWEPVIIGGAHGLAGSTVRAGKGFSLIVQGEYRVGIVESATDHAIGDRVYIMGDTFTTAMADADDPTTAVGILATDLPAGETSGLIRLVGADPQSAPVGGDVDAPTTGQFNTLKDRVSVTETDIAGHETRIDQLEAAGGGGGGGGDDPRVDQLVTDVQELDGRVTTLENAGGGGGGGGGGGAEITVMDLSASTPNQVTFLGLHNVDAYDGGLGQSGAIRFNRHVYSSGDQLVSAPDPGSAWMTVAKSGFYEVECSLYFLDQSTDPGSILFVQEKLVMDGDVSADGNHIADQPAIVNAQSYPGIVQFEAAASGTNQRFRSDIAFSNGPSYPLSGNRRVIWKWRVFMLAGKRIRVFGFMFTAQGSTTQFAYGGQSASNPANGTPELRYSHPIAPTLRITRIA